MPEVNSHITVAHQYKPLRVTHLLQLSQKELDMLRQCNQTNVANAVCVKITRSNDQKIEAYKDRTTCQGCFPTVCTKRTIGWASILWTRSNSGVYDYRIPFCKTCKSKVTQRAQMYID